MALPVIKHNYAACDYGRNDYIVMMNKVDNRATLISVMVQRTKLQGFVRIAACSKHESSSEWLQASQCVATMTEAQAEQWQTAQ
jgi:hypothetical protein